MQMDSRSSHPRTLTGRASEAFLTNQPQGVSLASLVKPSGESICICIYVYMYVYVYIYIDIYIYMCMCIYIICVHVRTYYTVLRTYIVWPVYKICDLLLSFECLETHLAFLEMTLASLWLSLDACESLWGTLGSQGNLFGITFVSLLLPWDAGGPLWGTMVPKRSLD